MTQFDLDLWIFLLRMVLVALLYLFLFILVRALRRDLRNAAFTPEPTVPTLGRLVVVESDQPSPEAGHVFGLEPRTTIGRGSHNTITLEDNFVSASHAVLILRGKRWWIEDIGSTNGTFLNRRQISEPSPVDFGDIIEVGRVKFKLLS